MTGPIDSGSDLFGEPVVRRDATFSGSCRWELRRTWGDGPIACVIGHNPSNAGADREDPTTRWLNRWFRSFGFGGYVIVNLYPWVSSSPADCYRTVADIHAGHDWGARDELHFHNLPLVVRHAKQGAQTFVCWGAIARDDGWIEHVVEEIQTGEEPWPDLWCWGTTAKGAPKHPMARGRHRIAPDQRPVLWRAAHG